MTLALGQEHSSPSRKALAAPLYRVLGCAFLAGRHTLAGLPRLAQGCFQLMSVGCVAPLQVLQLLIFLLVQDAQEILQFWKAESFPLCNNTETKNARCLTQSQD